MSAGANKEIYVHGCDIRLQPGSETVVISCISSGKNKLETYALHKQDIAKLHQFLSDWMSGYMRRNGGEYGD